VGIDQQFVGASHRLALITGCLDLGGTTTFLCNLGGELVRRGIPVRVFSFERDNPLATDFSRLGVPVSAYDEHELIYEDRLLAILGELAEFKPTAVLANLSATSFEVLRYMPAGVFRIGMAHSSHPGAYDLLQFYLGHVDVMAAVSMTIKKTLDGLPDFSAKVKYVPLGVPIPTEGSLPAKTFAAPLRILYLGRLDREHKRAHLLQPIFSQLRESGIPFHLTIAGEGPERAALEAQIKGSMKHMVSFAGKVPYSDVPSLLAAHDIFLLVSDSEGLPLSLVEAMGCGLVPVVSDLASGIGELVDKTTGKLVSPENIGGYAEAIIGLDQNREGMRQLSAAARNRVLREFSVGAMTDRLLALFPESPKAEAQWPGRWVPKAILAAPSAWRYLSPIRFFRRLLRRLS
jgi:glycosyltransferase involved in cell wall biosynthesis